MPLGGCHPSFFLVIVLASEADEELLRRSPAQMISRDRRLNPLARRVRPLQSAGAPMYRSKSQVLAVGFVTNQPGQMTASSAKRTMMPSSSSISFLTALLALCQLLRPCLQNWNASRRLTTPFPEGVSYAAGRICPSAPDARSSGGRGSVRLEASSVRHAPGKRSSPFTGIGQLC
jgi:hypothetical protein